MRVGEIITEKKIVRWHECQVCGLPAAWRISYLASGNCRVNPASKAYGRDDCSWSSDSEAFACKKHEQQVGSNPPTGMSWCSSFPLKNFKQMGFYLETIKEAKSLLSATK